MKLRSALNNGFFFLSLGAVFIGLTNFRDSNVIPLQVYLFLLFFVFFRTKMWLDDAHHFATANVKGSSRKEKWLFNMGVVFAIVAWSLWAMAGYSLKSLSLSYSYLAFSIAMLTVWILIAALATRSFDCKNGVWVILNIVYILALLILRCDTCTLPFDKDIIIMFMIAFTILDFLFSGSLEHFKEGD